MKTGIALFRVAVTLALAFGSLQAPAQTALSGTPESVPDVYRKTRNQAGHEFVKTEEFVVPVGAIIPIKGMSFAGSSDVLNPMDKAIVQQIFNSLEEITENTLADPDSKRVAEFRKMEFAVRGYIGETVLTERDAVLGERRAAAVVKVLTSLGTPPWRLHVQRVEREPAAADKPAAEPRKALARLEFVRIK